MSRVFPVVICVICGRQVDEMIEYRDAFNTDEVTLVVKCHGDTDRMTVNLLNLTREQIRELQNGEGRAFTTSRLENKTNEPSGHRQHFPRHGADHPDCVETVDHDPQ